MSVTFPLDKVLHTPGLSFPHQYNDEYDSELKKGK